MSAHIDLRKPLVVSRTAAFADGGSMNIDFVDAADNDWEIVRVGSVDVAAAKQRMLVVRWMGVVPARCEVLAGSALEGVVKQALLQWLSGRLTNEKSKLLAQGDAETFTAVPPEVVDVWAFANWIDNRR
jgi:hypothetical protein